MNLRGAKPVTDNAIKKFITGLNPVSDLYNEELTSTFTKAFMDWISASGNNTLSGLDLFPSQKLVCGTVQAFDHFYFRHRTKRFRFFKGEFMYHQSCLKHGCDWEYIEDKPLEHDDVLITSVPFSDYGRQHVDLEHYLNICNTLEIPVLLDFAYYPCTKNINVDLSQWKCVETIAFSISKAFYGAEFLRVGVRCERVDTDDGIDVFNSVEMNNRIDISIANSLIQQFPVDWNWQQYAQAYNKAIEDKNLLPTDCIMFGIGDDKWKDWNRGSDVNRVCISELIGDIVNTSSDA